MIMSMSGGYGKVPAVIYLSQSAIPRLGIPRIPPEGAPLALQEFKKKGFHQY